MRRFPVILLLLMALLSPPPALGQALESFATLPMKAGNQVVVVDRAGTRATGRLIRLTDTGITVKTAAGERSFTPGEVQEIGVRRRYRLLGTLVGAGVGGALAAWADCRGGENHNCDIDLPILLGAGVGFVAGASIHSTKTIYTRAGAAATPEP